MVSSNLVRDVTLKEVRLVPRPPRQRGVTGGSAYPHARARRLRRNSVGGALARASWTGFLQAAKEIAESGTFKGLAGIVPFNEINDSFELE